MPGTLQMLNKSQHHGQLRWLSGLVLPSAQGVILETQDRVPHQAPCMEPASPSACVSASLCVSLRNKKKKYLLKEGVNECVFQFLPVSSRLFGAADRQGLGSLVLISLVCTADWSMK